MLGIVLSGGGSKGSYQIGVWKALKKLRIKYDIVTGTSVGALNGIMMTQKDFKKSLKVWQNINYDNVVDNGTFDNKMDFVKYYTKSFVKQGGASINALEKLIDDVVDEKKFYKSKIDFGLITFNFSKLKPETVIKKNVKNGDIKKYIIASATCYPFFKKKKINNDKFIDGGYYDNLPINLAIDLGATEIIAVDLKAIGIKQKIKNDNIKVTYISPNNNIGRILTFEKKAAMQNIKFGYNDTMKIFQKLEGNKFTFKKNSLHRNYLKYGDKYFDLLSKIFSRKTNKLGTEKERFEHFNKIMENIGKDFELDESKIYSNKSFKKMLFKKLKEIENVDSNKNITLFNKKQVIKYFYSLINVDNKKLSNYDLILNDKVLEAIYLYSIK